MLGVAVIGVVEADGRVLVNVMGDATMSSLAATPMVLRSRFDRFHVPDESGFRTAQHGAAVPLSTVNPAQALLGAWVTARRDRVGPNDVPALAALVSATEGAA